MNAVKVVKPETVPLEANINGPGDVRDAIANLDKSVIYDLSNMSLTNYSDVNSPAKVRSLAILVMLKKPNIMIDMEHHAKAVFDAVRVNWLKSRKPHNAYWELEGTSLVKREVKDGVVYKPGIGSLSEANYVRNYTVLPYEFGTQDLFDSEEFSSVRYEALDILRKKAVKKKTMKDYIEVRE